MTPSTKRTVGAVLLGLWVAVWAKMASEAAALARAEDERRRRQAFDVVGHVGHHEHALADVWDRLGALERLALSQRPTRGPFPRWTVGVDLANATGGNEPAPTSDQPATSPATLGGGAPEA